MSRVTTRDTGARAEALARRHLEQHGLETIALNYSCRYGELDLVMRERSELVLVEVRFRQRPDPVDPAVTVTSTKQRRILRTAAHFLQWNPEYSDWPVRFDVLAISGSLEAPHIHWIRHGFDGSDVVTT